MAESKGSSSGLYRQGDHQQFDCKGNSKNATTFSFYSTCQQKAFGIAYSDGVYGFSLSDIHDGCQTSAIIYWGLFVAFCDNSTIFIFFLVSACRVCNFLFPLFNIENKFMKVTDTHF